MTRMLDHPAALLDAPTDALDRVELLTSALIDNVITDEGVRELGVLLEQDAGARRRYLDSMQRHAGLIEHYRDKR